MATVSLQSVFWPFLAWLTLAGDFPDSKVLASGGDKQVLLWKTPAIKESDK
jgi:hypothetical protein